MTGENGTFSFAEIQTQNGYPLDQVASALQKEIRRGNEEGALYWALELFPRFHNYLWKRLLTISVEDVADDTINTIVLSNYQSFEICNKDAKPKSNGKGKDIRHDLFIARAVKVLARAEKSRETDHYIIYMQGFRKKNKLDIPEYAKDVHTKEGRQNGQTKKDFIPREQRDLKNKTNNDKYFERIIDG